MDQRKFDDARSRNISGHEMDCAAVAEEIIALKNNDLVLRAKLVRQGELHGHYHEQMRAMHDRNADRLNELVDRIGYPTIDLVGKEAADAAWLIIQHAIGKPAFMKKCVKLLESAVNEQRADPHSLAYLSDRINVFEDRPQYYGTQFDWDEQGELSPNIYDDLAAVNKRRIAIGLNTLEEQTDVIRRRAREEKQLPPADFYDWKRQFNAWRRALGWIK